MKLGRLLCISWSQVVLSNTPKLEANIRGLEFKIRVSKVMPEGKSDGETLPERKEHNLCSVSLDTRHTSHITRHARQGWAPS